MKRSKQDMEYMANRMVVITEDICRLLHELEHLSRYPNDCGLTAGRATEQELLYELRFLEKRLKEWHERYRQTKFY